MNRRVDTRGIRRSRRGFSMAEVLVVIVVLGIVAAIAAPNVVQMQREYRLFELNAKAEQIYNAAQYRATALQSAGKLSQLFEAVDTDRGPITPKGYDYSLSGDAELYYTWKGQSAADDFLLTDDTATITKATANGKYAIEFSPKTGEIYSVFYWEPDAPGYEDSADVFYENHFEQRLDSERLNIPLGYYEGGTVSAAASTSSGALGNVKVSVVNGEELYIRLFSKNFVRFAEDLDSNRLNVDDFSVNVIVTDANDSTKKRTREFKAADFAGLEEGAQEIDIVLDSLTPGQSFNDLVNNANNDEEGWTGTGTIRHGSDIDVAVIVKYGEDTPYNSEDNPERVNSAFANPLPEGDDEDGGEGEGGTAQPNTVRVKYLRHLRNLDKNYAGESLASDAHDTRVVIISDIDFNGTSWGSLREGKVPVVSAALRDDANWNPLSKTGGTFEPIMLAEEFNVKGGSSISAAPKDDGTYYTLKNFNIKRANDEGADNTGLFASSAVALNNITLDNVAVEGASKVGALVGTLSDGGSINSCLVAGNVSVTGSGSYVGGLVGSAEGEFHIAESGVGIIDASHESPARPEVSSTNGASIGGLIGQVAGTGSASIQNSWTAATVSAGSSDAVGGFVGQTDGATLEGSYSSGSVSGRNNVGGFAGVATGNTFVKNCFATSDAAGTAGVGGFVGAFSAALDWENSRAYGLVSDGSNNTCGFSGTGTPNASGCKYLRMVNYNDKITSEESKAYASSYGDLALPDASAGDANGNSTHPFRSILKDSGRPFPFPRVGGLAYYGDWPLAVKVVWAYSAERVYQEIWALDGTDVAAPEPATEATLSSDGARIVKTTYTWSDVSLTHDESEIIDEVPLQEPVETEMRSWDNPQVLLSSAGWVDLLVDAELIDATSTPGQVTVSSRIVLSSNGAYPDEASSAREYIAGALPGSAGWTVIIPEGTMSEENLLNSCSIMVGDAAIAESGGEQGVWLYDGSGLRHGTIGASQIGAAGAAVFFYNGMFTADGLVVQ